MVPEAPLERTGTGAIPAADGWFVLNVQDARWYEDDRLGVNVPFDSETAPFSQLGINLSILRPGQPMSVYHAEDDAQEDFLVLDGECALIIEGEERTLRAWDFVHCPPGTAHVIVGAGDRPCLVLAVGARVKGHRFRYPANELARRYGASAERDTSDPREAYAGFNEPKPVACPPGFPPQ